MKKDLMQELKKYLEKDGNSMATLAAKLGCKSSTTIYGWTRSNRIPPIRERQLAAVLGVKDWR